jgi:hypothetical protein
LKREAAKAKLFVVVSLDFRQTAEFFNNYMCGSILKRSPTAQNALLHRARNFILAKNTYRRPVLVRVAGGAASAMDR